MRKLAILLILIICGTLLSGCKAQEHTKEYTKNTKFPGPRYFGGRVSEGEIYAGIIIAMIGTSRDPDFSIIYLKRTTTDEGEHLPKYVEQLVKKPLRPIIYQENIYWEKDDEAEIEEKVEKRWPVNIPIWRVADDKHIWANRGAYSEVINHGAYVELGSIKTVGGLLVYVQGRNTWASLAGEYPGFEVTLSNGRLKFTAVEIEVASSEKRAFGFNSGN